MIDPEQLMALARKKYVSLKEEGKWSAPTAADTNLADMEAKITCIKSSGQSFQKGLGSSSNNNNGGKGKKKGKGGKKKGKSGKKKGKGGKKKGKDGPPEWAKTPPKKKDTKTKTIEPILWYWRNKHNRLVQHHPSECRLNDSGKSGEYKTPTNSQSNNGSDTKLRLTKALANTASATKEAL